MAAPILLSALSCGKCLNNGFLLMGAASMLISALVAVITGTGGTLPGRCQREKQLQRTYLPVQG